LLQKITFLFRTEEVSDFSWQKLASRSGEISAGIFSVLPRWKTKKCLKTESVSRFDSIYELLNSINITFGDLSPPKSLKRVWSSREQG